MPPETRYAKSGDLHIAYQVIGDGPFDLVYVPGWVSHLEMMWEEPAYAHRIQRLSSFARLIMLDKRGTGMSDRVPNDALPTLEQRMDDVRVVMDAAGSEQAVLFGISEGSAMCLFFAASYPERTSALALYAGFARYLAYTDYPWGRTPADCQRWYEEIEQSWGRVRESIRSDTRFLNDERKQNWFARYERMSVSPGAALALAKMCCEIDVREILPAIHVPTLVLHHVGDPDHPIEEARYLARCIAGAKLVELPGACHTVLGEEAEPVLEQVELFLTGARPVLTIDRVLATVLYTDIVGSTQKAAELGDRRFRELLESHHAIVRKELARFRGREIETSGDGFLATFDGPARAIHCAEAIRDHVQSLGIQVRAGVHTGECELMGDKIGGIAVHLGARVMAMAGPGEVLVSSTVRDLVAGSGIQFVERGVHTLKGVPGEWKLYGVC